VINKIRTAPLRYVSEVAALYGLIWQLPTKQTAFYTSVWDPVVTVSNHHKVSTIS